MNIEKTKRDGPKYKRAVPKERHFFIGLFKLAPRFFSEIQADNHPCYVEMRQILFIS